MMPRKIDPSVILPFAEYGRQRAERRKRMTEIKKDRRLEVGPFATFYFESYDTMLHQVHEMLFIEKGGAEQLPDELAAYNPLIRAADAFERVGEIRISLLGLADLLCNTLRFLGFRPLPFTALELGLKIGPRQCCPFFSRGLLRLMLAELFAEKIRLSACWSYWILSPSLMKRAT